MGYTDTSVCLTHPEHAQDPAVAARELRAIGVGCAWVFGYGAVRSHDFAAANQAVLQAAQAHDDLFTPIALVNPFHAEREAQFLVTSGFKGVKILTGWGNWLTIDNIRRTIVPLARILAGAGMHLSLALEGNAPLRGGSVYLPLIVREACPEITLVLDHLWTPYTWPDYLTIAQEDPSLWLTLHDLPTGLLEEIRDRIGLQRVLFGSWHPERSSGETFERICNALDVPSAELETAFTVNARRVLAARHANQTAAV